MACESVRVWTSVRYGYRDETHVLHTPQLVAPHVPRSTHVSVPLEQEHVLVLFALRSRQAGSSCIEHDLCGIGGIKLHAATHRMCHGHRVRNNFHLLLLLCKDTGCQSRGSLCNFYLLLLLCKHIGKYWKCKLACIPALIVGRITTVPTSGAGPRRQRGEACHKARQPSSIGGGLGNAFHCAG